MTSLLHSDDGTIQHGRMTKEAAASAAGFLPGVSVARGLVTAS
jgi:hypothetical protein